MSTPFYTKLYNKSRSFIIFGLGIFYSSIRYSTILEYPTFMLVVKVFLEQ